MINKNLMFAKIIISLVLVVIIITVNADYRKKFIQIDMEKQKYNQYISFIANISNKENTIITDKVLIKDEFNKFMNYLENSRIISIDQFSENNEKLNLFIKIKKDYILNFLDYLYDTSNSFSIESFSFNGLEREYMKINFVVSFLYSLPVVNFMDYFGKPNYLNVNFWEEELLKLESVEKNKEIREDISMKSITQPSPKREFNLDIKYKGNVVISNKRYAIVEYLGNDIFIEEGSFYNIGDFNIKVISADSRILKVEIDGNFYEYQLDVI